MRPFSLFPRIRARRSMALACAALLAAALVSAPDVAAQTFECELNKSKVRVTGWRVSRTRITTYEDVLNTDVSFIQGGTTPGCVVVQFSAQVTVGEGKFMYVRAILESEATGTQTILQPGPILFTGQGAERVHSFSLAEGLRLACIPRECSGTLGRTMVQTA